MIMAEQTIDNLDLEEEDSGSIEYQHQEDSQENDSEFLGGTYEPNYSEQPNDDSTVMEGLLKYYGINDKSKITFEDEQGMSQKNWDDLSFEEKMNILRTSNTQPERDLDDEEIALINDIRRRNLTPSNYLNQIVQASQQSAPQAPQYSIDDLTDDELFILDLQDRVPDISDEDVTEALTKAKENTALYQKQVNGIRNELKQQEQNYLQEQQLEIQQQQQQQFNNFANSVGQNVASLNRIGNLDLNLDDNDRDNIMSFILDIDDTGMSTLGKALNDPAMLVKLSWYALYGDTALNTIQSYFADQIKKANLSGYQRGYEEAKKGTSKVVYTRNQSQQPSSIDDIYG